jgi:hypothetical protein
MSLTPEELTTQLQSCIDQYGFDDVLVTLAQICADKALDDYLPDGTEMHDIVKRFREGSHYGTPLGRAAEWIKMADRIYELSHFYDPAANCPNFVHPPFN